VSLPIGNNIEIRAYRESDWDRLRLFTRTNWREDHPFTSRRLFEWQFHGFGNSNRKINSLIMLQGDEVIGFRGIIPGLYQVPSDIGEMHIVQGGSFAMWMIAKKFRGAGLGVLMHQEAQKAMPVITGAGSNPHTSVPIYLKHGFSVLDSMHRFVAPLQAEVYQKLLATNVDLEDIAHWASVWDRATMTIPPSEQCLDAIAALWQKTTFPLRIFSLYRNSDFFRWRYVDSAGFQYLFFGSPDDPGVIIARIEAIYSDTREELHDRRVFRIIEVLPRNTQAWMGQIDRPLIELIRGVLRWAIEQGCIAADFYCSSSRLVPVLQKAGLRNQNCTSPLPECNLATLFQPLTYKAKPINALYRIETCRKALRQIDFDDVYQVKSDNDMDRPNLLDVAQLN
jgi:hypothetical protein